MKHTRRALFALLLMPLLALAAPPKPAAPPAVAEALPEDVAQYAVWSALLAHGLPADTQEIIIAAQTTTDTNPVVAPGANLEAVAKKLALDPALLRGWLRANESRETLTPRLTLKAKYQLLDDATRAKIFAGEDPVANWARFKQRYPDAPGILRLSRAAFDPFQQQALVYLEFSCGPACGSGRLIHAARDGKGWKALSGELIWIAGP